MLPEVGAPFVGTKYVSEHNYAEYERKIGQRKENFDDEKLTDSLKKVKQLIRCDWGGKDAKEQLAKQMLELGIKCGPESITAFLAIMDRQMEGSRKRTAPRLNDAIRRLSESNEPHGNIVEELP